VVIYKLLCMDNHDENPIEAENVSQDKNTTLALVSHLLGLVTWMDIWTTCTILSF